MQICCSMSFFSSAIALQSLRRQTDTCQYSLGDLCWKNCQGQTAWPNTQPLGTGHHDNTTHPLPSIAKVIVT